MSIINILSCCHKPEERLPRHKHLRHGYLFAVSGLITFFIHWPQNRIKAFSLEISEPIHTTHLLSCSMFCMPPNELHWTKQMCAWLFHWYRTLFCTHTVLSLPLSTGTLHAAASVRCGLQAVYACPAMAHWVSGIGVNRLPWGLVTCGRENLQGIILLVLVLSLPIITTITVSRHSTHFQACSALWALVCHIVLVSLSQQSWKVCSCLQH